MDYGAIAGYIALACVLVMWTPWLFYRLGRFVCTHEYTGWCGSQFVDESGHRYFAVRVRWCDACDKLDKELSTTAFVYNRWLTEATSEDWYG